LANDGSSWKESAGKEDETGGLTVGRDELDVWIAAVESGRRVFEVILLTLCLCRATARKAGRNMAGTELRREDVRSVYIREKKFRKDDYKNRMERISE